jgi:hypothetical protein
VRDNGVTLATLDIQTVEDQELQQIRRWRLEILSEAGYAPGVAAELADRLDVDLHQAVRLLERGCPVDLAAQILI